MQRLEVSGAVRPLKWPLGVKRLKHAHFFTISLACCEVFKLNLELLESKHKSTKGLKYLRHAYYLNRKYR
jgi:hypothetical protein